MKIGYQLTVGGEKIEINVEVSKDQQWKSNSSLWIISPIKEDFSQIE